MTTDQEIVLAAGAFVLVFALVMFAFLFVAIWKDTTEVVRQQFPLVERTEVVPGRKPGRPRVLKERPQVEGPSVTRILSIDPGDVHQGICTATLDPDKPEGSQLQVRWQGDWTRGKLVDELEEYAHSQVTRVDAVLLEKFVLYPWMAREQGFSQFLTVEVIGIVKHLVDKLDVPCIMTDTSNKDQAVAVARANQPRLLRTYPNRKKGKVYFIGSNEHERDALAHLVWFAWRDQRSPLYQAKPGNRRMAQ